jgi:hypothetical protein
MLDACAAYKEDYPLQMSDGAKRIDWQPLLDRHKFLRSSDQIASDGLGVNTLLKLFVQALGYLI